MLLGALKSQDTYLAGTFLLFVASLTVIGTLVSDLLLAALDPRIDVTGIGAGPVVVIGTTGDASTPLESSRNMARALEDGRLVIVDAEQHTGYSASECAQDLVDRYLVDLEAPDDETEC